MKSKYFLTCEREYFIKPTRAPLFLRSYGKILYFPEVNYIEGFVVPVKLYDRREVTALFEYKVTRRDFEK